MALTIGKLQHVKAIFRTHKSNENTTDLYIKLLKTVTVKVLESNYFRKLSYGIANVVEGGSEGWFFEEPSFDCAQDDSISYGFSKNHPRATAKRVGCGGCFT